MRELISLSGYAETGKDAAAEVLVERYGYVLAAPGRHVASLLAEVNPLVVVGGLMVGYAQVLEQAGYEGSKKVPLVREMLQDLGTGIKRHVPAYWLDRVLENRPAGQRMVMAGMRSRGEIDGVKAAGGVTIRIHRPGKGPMNGHENETDLDECVFDAHVHNDSTVEELVRQVVAAAGG